MAITLVQTRTGNAGGYNNTVSGAFGSNVTAGNFIVLAITAGSANTIASVADSLSNSYTLVKQETSANRRIWLYYAQNISGGANTITVTFTAGQFPSSILQAREYSGLATSSVLDVEVSSNSGSSNVTSHPTGTSATTTQANELVVAIVAVDGNLVDPVISVPSGYSNLVRQSAADLYTYSAMADLIVSSTGTQSATFGTTNAGIGQAILATFKAAGGGYTQTTLVNLMGASAGLI